MTYQVRLAPGALSPAAGPLSPGGGSLFGGGAAGINARDMEMMGRGRAPFTARGIATALGNAMSVVNSSTSPLGLMGLGMTATGTRPDGFWGSVVDNVLGGGISNIPGYSAYDKDLMAAVKAGSMTRAQADKTQAQRSAVRNGAAMANSAINSGMGMAVGHPGMRGALSGGGGGNAGGGYGGGGALDSHGQVRGGGTGSAGGGLTAGGPR